MERTFVLFFALLGVAACSYWTPEPEFYECCASGDPHYELFDGQWIHFQGQCKYLMAGTCHNCTDCDYEAFHVFVDNRPWAHNPARSVTDLVEIHFAGYIVTFQNGATNPTISGVADPPTLPFVGPGFVVSMPSANHFVFEATNGLRVTYQNGHIACIRVPNCVYRNEMCGICGNMNNMQDDYFTSDGTDVSAHWNKYNLIGDSWEVAGGDCNGQTGATPYVQYNTEPHRCCELINTVFATCKLHEPDMVQGYITSCNMDANDAPGIYDAWWSMVEAVYEACDNKGYAPGAGWQNGFRPCLQSEVPVEETAPVHFVRQ